jgi:HSP20 family molecular chaperone IbpA
MALAGFTENDVKVWHDGHVLNINGSNRNNQEIADKFTCEFSHSIAISKNLELSKAEVSLINGILSIKIPINKDKTKKNFLFGRDDKSLLTDGK